MNVLLNASLAALPVPAIVGGMVRLLQRQRPPAPVVMRYVYDGGKHVMPKERLQQLERELMGDDCVAVVRRWTEEGEFRAVVDAFTTEQLPAMTAAMKASLAGMDLVMANMKPAGGQPAPDGVCRRPAPPAADPGHRGLA